MQVIANEKEAFIAPELEIVELEAEDIITESQQSTQGMTNNAPFAPYTSTTFQP